MFQAPSNWNTTKVTAPTLDWGTFQKYIAPSLYSGDPRGALNQRDQWAGQLGWDVGGKGNFLIEGLDRDKFFAKYAPQVNAGFGDNAGAESLNAMGEAFNNPEAQKAWREAVDKALADPNTMYQVMGDRLTNVDGSAATNEGARRSVRYKLQDGKLVPVAQYDSDRTSSWASIRDEFLPIAGAILGGGYLYGAGAGAGAGAGTSLGEVAAGNGAFLGEGVASGVGAWDSAAGLGAAAAGGTGAYVPANAAGAVGGVGSPTATQGYQLGQMAGQLGTGAAPANPGAYAGVMGATPGSGAGAGYAAGSGGLAPVVDAVAIPGLGAGTPNMSLGSALGDLASSYAGSLSTKDWLQLISSGYNWWQSDRLSDRAGGIDPFGAYRSGYARQLAELMANPSSVTKLPGYDASLKAAEQALTRNLAAQGLTGSGTAAEALANFGGQFQNQFYQQQIAQLAGLSGANFNNAPAALQADIASWNAQNQIINNLVKILPHLGLG